MPAICFANEFWGLDDSGVTALIGRMSEAKTINEELRSYYRERAAIEDDYARRLTKLAKQPLGGQEIASLGEALSTVRDETAAIASQHGNMAIQLKVEVEEAHGKVADSVRERRKNMQVTIERLWRTKAQQQNDVKRLKERYDNDCLKINSHLAQQNLLLGKELDKNNLKLDKVQSAVKISQAEYRTAVQALAETMSKWNKEWKVACDLFQDLEEERLASAKSSLWSLTNVISAVCVTDDESCERIRQSLERVDVQRELAAFVDARRTGNEIPDPPKFRAFGEDAERHGQVDVSLANFRRKSTRAANDDDDDDRSHTHGHTTPQPKQHNRTKSRGNSPQSIVNPHPIDGITQLCRSDSASTYVSRANSNAGSAITTSSVYSSIPGTNKHTPQPSVELMSGRDTLKATGGSLTRKKSFLSRDDGSSWFTRPASPNRTAPTEIAAPAPQLKAQKTGGSIFDVLRPARSRSRASQRANEQSPSRPTSTAPPIDSTTVLSPQHTVKPVTLKDEQRASRKFDDGDPIAAALEKLKVSSRPSSMVDPSSPRGSPTRQNGRPQAASPQRSYDRDDTPFSRISASSSPQRSQDNRRSIHEQNQRSSYHEASNGMHAPGDLRRSGTPSTVDTRPESDDSQRTVLRDDSLRRSVHGYAGSSVSSAMSDNSRASYRNGHVNGALEPDASLRSSRRYEQDMGRSTSPRPQSVNHQDIDELDRKGRSSRTSDRPDDSPYDGRLQSPTRPRANSRPTAPAQHYGDPRYDPTRGRSPDRQAEEPTYHALNRTRSRSFADIQRAAQADVAAAARDARASNGDRHNLSPSRHTNSDGHSQVGSNVSNNSASTAASSRISHNSHGSAPSASSAQRHSGAPKVTADGREILSFARALYDYQAAAPEEIGFGQGDVLAITEVRDDGWWVGEVCGLRRGRRGLVPSNFFTRVTVN